MSKSATKEGTKRYAEKFRGRAAQGHFREMQRLALSSLGIGTYLGEPDEKTDEGYAAAAVAAVESGINVIDAAINYRFQRSERSIGAAIRQLVAKGIERDEIVVCTKGGYLTPDGAMPGDSNEYFFREKDWPYRRILRACSRLLAPNTNEAETNQTPGPALPPEGAS